VRRSLGSAIAFLAVLAPALAQAQTNIDQGQSAAQLFAADCAVCHKSVRALASGKTASTLASFLVEHYTSSRQEASALSAYVMSGGAGSGAVADPRTPEPGRTGTPPDTGPRQARKPPKPDEAPAPTAKLQQPGGDDAKPPDAKPPDAKPAAPPAAAAPPAGPTAGRHPPAPAVANRGRQQKPGPGMPAGREPGTVIAAPAVPAGAAEGSGADNGGPAPGPSAAAPASDLPGEGGPVPRDNIPD
jgi:hypothetical protein